MDEEQLSPIVRNAICDRLEGWELVDFLQISTDDIVDLFEEDILEHLEDVLDFIGLRKDNNTDDGDSE